MDIALTFASKWQLSAGKKIKGSEAMFVLTNHVSAIKNYNIATVTRDVQLATNSGCFEASIGNANCIPTMVCTEKAHTERMGGSTKCLLHLSEYF